MPALLCNPERQREPVMKGWLLIVLAASMNLAGCAASFDYQTGPPAPYVPHITDVPPSFYDNDPALRHWYTYPYWNPNRDVFP